MEQIFRVEHPESGGGPYNPGIVYGPDGNDIRDHISAFDPDFFWGGQNRPAPQNDIPDYWDIFDKYDRDLHYGFRDFETMCNWWSLDELSKLTDIGFRIYTYRVRPVSAWHGWHQSIFRKSCHIGREVWSR